MCDPGIPFIQNLPTMVDHFPCQIFSIKYGIFDQIRYFWKENEKKLLACESYFGRTCTIKNAYLKKKKFL